MYWCDDDEHFLIIIIVKVCSIFLTIHIDNGK